jgi:hypothetical protein
MSTLYQYCIFEHIQQLNVTVLNNPALDNLSPKERIKKLAIVFTEYLLLHPTTFELIFLVPLTTEPPQDISDDLLKPQVIMEVRRSIEAYLEEKNIPQSDYETITQIFLNHLIGRLLFYFRRTKQSSFAASRNASCDGRKVSLNASCQSSRQDAEMKNFPIVEQSGHTATHSANCFEDQFKHSIENEVDWLLRSISLTR